MIEADEPGFASVIEKLHASCDESRLVVATSKEIASLKHLENKVYELIHLQLQQGIKILLEKCPRNIDDEELIELISSVPGCENLLAHPFTKYLGGFPMRIIETAQELKDKRLVEFYKGLLQES